MNEGSERVKKGVVKSYYFAINWGTEDRLEYGNDNRLPGSDIGTEIKKFFEWMIIDSKPLKENNLFFSLR